jgi:hypothetical protein
VRYKWPVEFVSSENRKPDTPESCVSVNFRKSQRPTQAEKQPTPAASLNTSNYPN